MNQPILVTGRTGSIGSRVIPLLREAGRSVRILTRHPHSDSPGIQHVVGDTTQDTGLADAFDGIRTILHLAGGAKGDDIAARNIVSAAQKSQATHLVLISVVGADRMPIGYFRAKAAAEAAFADSGLPWTVIRVAQLHDLVLPVVRTLRGIAVPSRADGRAVRARRRSRGRPAIGRADTGRTVRACRGSCRP